MRAHPVPSTRSARRDPLEVLAAVRPSAGGDQSWTSRESGTVLRQILATPSGGPAPVSSRHGRRHSRRAAVISLAALTVVGGAGAATAAGLVPQAFTDAFSGWRTWHDPSVAGGDHPVDPAVARRVATARGPQGTVFAVVAARAVDDPSYVCLDALYESGASSDERLPADFEGVLGDRCQNGPMTGNLGALSEGSVARAATMIDTGLGVTQDTLVWTMGAGSAVRATAHTADGLTYPAVVFDGHLFGWVPIHGDDAGSVTVTAYDEQGAVIGQVDLTGNPVR